MSSPLTIARTQRRDEVTLDVRGEIDMATAPALERELQEAESSLPRRIVLDLAALDFVDSTGIRVLILAQRRADAAGHELVLARVPAHARRLFEITGLDARLTID